MAAALGAALAVAAGLADGKGRAAGHHLAAVQGSVLGAAVQSVHTDGDSPITVTELTFADRPALHLGACHTPAVRRLSAAMGEGPVVLARIAHHGRCWGLYFRTDAGGRLPLLAASASIVPDDGGGLRLGVPRLTPR